MVLYAISCSRLPYGDDELKLFVKHETPKKLMFTKNVVKGVNNKFLVGFYHWALQNCLALHILTIHSQERHRLVPTCQQVAPCFSNRALSIMFFTLRYPLCKEFYDSEKHFVSSLMCTLIVISKDGLKFIRATTLHNCSETRMPRLIPKCLCRKSQSCTGESLELKN